MKVKAYVGSSNECTPCVSVTQDDVCDPNKNVMVMDNGCRVEERVSVVENADGTVDEVREIHEEVVPMRLSQRVTRTLKCVPIAEKMECIAADGSIETHVTNLSEKDLELGKVKNESNLETIASELASVKQMLAASPSSKKRSFLSLANDKYGASTNGVVLEEEEVEIQQSSWVSTTLGVMAYVVLAVVAGLLTYSLI